MNTGRGLGPVLKFSGNSGEPHDLNHIIVKC